ncbi:MAG: hypothetical protein ACLUOI_26345 [Eisenbergiella sp.]
MQAYRLMSEKYGNEILLSCSIGLYRKKKETFENLYSCADEALYFSKNGYKGTFHWYTVSAEHNRSAADGSLFLE